MTASQPTPILVERRFPLDLSESIGSIRDLYETGKRERWDPERDVPWGELDASRYDAATRDAARAVWSRRAWIEYTGLAETPALLIRFCLETGREADPKYFLSVRNTEEAWHVETFHRVAESLGGYIEAPTNRAWEPVFNQTLYRQALSAEHGLDAYVAVHCALEDGLELELFEAYAANARDPAVRALLDRVVADKRRHASFGWLYLESRARGLSDDAKREIERTAGAWLREVAAAGYHVPSLATAIDCSPEREALRRTAEAGLGAVTAETEEALLQAYLARARARMAELGLALPPLAHSRLGTL